MKQKGVILWSIFVVICICFIIPATCADVSIVFSAVIYRHGLRYVVVVLYIRSFFFLNVLALERQNIRFPRDSSGYGVKKPMK